jgi:two-component system response regulator FixJ
LMKSVGLPAQTFSSADEFLAADSSHRPACVILDVRMPGRSGLDLQEKLAAEAGLPVILITGHGNVSMSVRAMKSGAADFLEKPFDDQVLLEAIHRALERSLRVSHANAYRSSIQERVALLTGRERQVFELVATGRLNREIGVQLGINEKTVKHHRGRVMRKLQVTSLARLVRLAAEGGILPWWKDSAPSPVPEDPAVITES